jgi:hypothetical protein
MLAQDVADEIIANIANGPTYIVGARNPGHRRARMARPPDVGPDDRRTHQRPRGPHERHALLCDGSGSTC